MFSRIVSLLLIAAVVTCPLCCVVGMCQGGACCSNRQAAAGGPAAGGRAAPTGSCLAVESVPQSARKACCSSPSTDRSVPAPSPDRSSPDRPSPDRSQCQGICGGAVLERVCEVPHDEDFHFLPVTDARVSVRVLSTSHQDRAGEQFCSPRANYGRFVRALHESFLC